MVNENKKKYVSLKTLQTFKENADNLYATKEGLENSGMNFKSDICVQDDNCLVQISPSTIFINDPNNEAYLCLDAEGIYNDVGNFNFHPDDCGGFIVTDNYLGSGYLNLLEISDGDTSQSRKSISISPEMIQFSNGSGETIYNATSIDTGLKKYTFPNTSGRLITQEETDVLLQGKASSIHNHDDKYDTKGSADTALASAKTYADEAANTVKNDLLNGAGAAYDTLKELGDLIDTNVDAIEALEIVAAGKADKTHNHDGVYATVDDVTNIQTQLDGKADSTHTHSNATTSAAGFMTAAMVEKLNGIEAGANKITVDSDLSLTSTNPVQNQVINRYLEELDEYITDANLTAIDALNLANGKANAVHTHSISDITNLQSSLDSKVPTSRTINGKTLSSNITITASDINVYTKSEIDNMEFITVNDIDTICGATIQVASINEVTF